MRGAGGSVGIASAVGGMRVAVGCGVWVGRGMTLTETRLGAVAGAATCGVGAATGLTWKAVTRTMTAGMAKAFIIHPAGWERAIGRVGFMEAR